MRKIPAAGSEAGQSMFETVLMVWLLTLLISAIIQVFMVHDFAFQMANNAYYSMFKTTYRDYNKPDVEFKGYDRWRKKPLQRVDTGHALVPMMPYFEQAIKDRLHDEGLMIGSPVSGSLQNKYYSMATGTEGGFGAFIDMIEALVELVPNIGGDYTDYTGYDEDYLEGLGDDADGAKDDLEEDREDPEDTWWENHYDGNGDGYDDDCVDQHNGEQHPDCSMIPPWLR